MPKKLPKIPTNKITTKMPKEITKEIIVDASAIMALINQEEGYKIVEKHLNHAIISSVNFSEALVIINRSIPDEPTQKQAAQLLKNTFPHIINFDPTQAQLAATLDKSTKPHTLSLGARACLALAKQKNLPALTADKVWKKLKIDVDVRLIR
jgi:ribonuclease VapC